MNVDWECLPRLHNYSIRMCTDSAKICLHVASHRKSAIEECNKRSKVWIHVNRMLLIVLFNSVVCFCMIGLLPQT